MLHPYISGCRRRIGMSCRRAARCLLTAHTGSVESVHDCQVPSIRESHFRRQHGAPARQARYPLGWSDPGDTVRVQIGDNTATGTAGPDRRWQVKLQPPAPGGPYTLKITGHETVEL